MTLSPETIGAIVFLSPAVAVFAYWLYRTEFGKTALEGTRARRNLMPFYIPLAVFFLWWLILSLVYMVSTKWIEPDGWRAGLILNIALAVAALTAILVMVRVVRLYFARGLRGFGFRLRGAGRDFYIALLNLYGIWPVVLASILLTDYAARQIYGPDWQIEQHEQIQILLKHPHFILRVILFVVTVGIVPVFEEMLFRGLIQSKLRSYLGRPWAAVAVTSVAFAVVHGNISHWPALFVLSMCMGYSYERSGSLLRPIFIHAFFNGIMLTLAMFEGQAQAAALW